MGTRSSIFGVIIAVLLGSLLGAGTQAQDQYKTELVLQIGHSDAVLSVAFSPDGTRVLSGELDGTLKLWDAATGQLLRSFKGHKDLLLSVAFSPDGTSFLSGSGDSTLKLWDAATGRLLRSFEGHLGAVNSVAFSPNGTILLSGGQRTLKLWDAATGQLLRSFYGHTGVVNSVAFSLDGTRLLSGSDDKTLKLWDAATGELLRSFEGHTAGVNSVAFFPDGRRLLSGSDDWTFKLWDAATGQLLRSFEGHTAGVASVAFSPDGTRFLSGSWDGTLKLWDTATGRLLRSFEGHTEAVRSIVFSPGGTLLLSGGNDKTLKLWDAATGQLLRSFKVHAEAVNSIAFSPDGRRVLSGDIYGTLKLWDPATGQLLRSFKGQSDIPITFSPDGMRALEEDLDGTLKLWDTATGRLLRSFKHTDGYSLAFSPDGRRVLSGDIYGTLKLWDPATGQLLRSFKASVVGVSSAAFSADGTRVLSGSSDGPLKLWDTATGRLLRSFKGHSESVFFPGVFPVAFSPDGRRLLSGGDDKTLKLWDAATGQLLHSFEGHTEAVNSVAFSPDGRRLLSGGDDKTLKLWDAATGQLLRSFEGHAAEVKSVAFSPDGTRILSGSHDGTIRIWKQDQPEPLASFIGLEGGDFLTVTPAGFFAASAHGDQGLSVVRGVKAYSILQFYEHLNWPDLLEANLKGDPDGKYRDTASKLDIDKILNSGPAPQLDYLENKTEKSEEKVKLAIRIKDTGGGIGGKVVWRVNGKTQGDLTTPGLAGPPAVGRAVSMSQELKVDPGVSNTVEITAYNAAGLLASLPFKIMVDPFGVTTEERPRLHVLAIGVEHYAMKDYELHYAVKDAQAFVDAMTTVGSTLFSEVKPTLLQDGQVTKAGIEAAINELAGEVKPTDVFVLFLGGHGRAIAGKYYFVQQDLEFAKGQSIEADGIGIELWQQWLAKVPAQKTLLVFDTCESAAAAGLVRGGERERQAAMEQLQYATGQNLIAAARQAAHEGYHGHGVLTYAILEAFQKPGTPVAVEKIDVDGLASYVGDKVPEITKSLYGERQEPIRKLSGSNFPLGLRVLSRPAEDECPESEDFIVIREEGLRDKPDPAAGVKRTLPLYSKAGAVFEGDWALLCRDGVTIGYVPKDAVAQTK